MPPSITKQSPNSSVATAPKASPGSLLSRGVPLKDLRALFSRIVALFYGINRVGKTSLMAEFDKPMALLTFEPAMFTGGSSSILSMPGIDQFFVIPVTAVDTWKRLWPAYKARLGLPEISPICGTDEAVALAAELAQDSRYKTVGLDSATSLQDVCLTELMNLPELPSQLRVAKAKGDTSWGVVPDGVYQDRSAKAKEVLRRFINLPQDVVISAKEKDHNPPKDDNGKVRRNKLTRGLDLGSFIAADLGQATAEWLMDACHCVCRLYSTEEVIQQELDLGAAGKSIQEIKTGRTTRRLLTQLHPNFAAGVRADVGPDPSKVPEYVEGSTPKELYKKLMAIIRPGKAA